MYLLRLSKDKYTRTNVSLPSNVLLSATAPETSEPVTTEVPKSTTTVEGESPPTFFQKLKGKFTQMENKVKGKEAPVKEDPNPELAAVEPAPVAETKTDTPATPPATESKPGLLAKVKKSIFSKTHSFSEAKPAESEVASSGPIVVQESPKEAEVHAPPTEVPTSATEAPTPPTEVSTASAWTILMALFS